MSYDAHHEPKCPQCRRFDADCKCDWPMPSSAQTTPPDDEAQAQPEPETGSFSGFELMSDEDGDYTWVLVPGHSIENLSRALDFVALETDTRYTRAHERWAIDHSCPDDCDACDVENGELVSWREESGEDPDDVPDCWCHSFEGTGMQFVKDQRPGALPAYEIDEASRA